MLNLLTKRRSIRKFKDQEIEKEKIDQIVKAALLSPSSRGICPWEFMIVNDKNLLEKLSYAKEHGSLFLKDAPLGIVVLADETKSDVWIEDTAIASIIIQLAAESMGLGSCWIQIRNRVHHSTQTAENDIKNLLTIPEQYKVESIIAIGYPAEEKRMHGEGELQFDKVHMNQYHGRYN